MTNVNLLGGSRFALVTTFRRDGTPVPTPVWIAPIDDWLGIWTVADSGKVKRLRRSGRLTVSTYDYRGRHAGETFEGRGTILGAEDTEVIRNGMKRKYGLYGWLVMEGSRLRRGSAGTVGIKIVLADA